MTEQETDGRSGGLDYVRYGPRAGGDSVLLRALGVFLWWRIWATGFVFMGGIQFVLYIAPSGWSPRFGTPDFYILVGFFIGFSTAVLTERVIWNE